MKNRQVLVVTHSPKLHFGKRFSSQKKIIDNNLSIEVIKMKVQKKPMK